MIIIQWNNQSKEISKISSIYSLCYRYMKFIFTKTVFFCCFSFQKPISICFFRSRYPFFLSDFLGLKGRMAYQECWESLASQGRKDNKKKMDLRESLVSRDRGDRCAPGMMGLKGDKGNKGSRGKCFRNSLRWSIYIINSVDKTKLSCNIPHRRSYKITLFEYLRAWPPFPAAVC